MSHPRNWLSVVMSRRTGLAAVALCAMAGLPSTPVGAAGAVTTSLFLPLVGTVFQPSDPCTPPPGEGVNLKGLVNVVSIVPLPPVSQLHNPSIKLHFNMADA